MPRFYIPPANWNPACFLLDPAEAHHAVNVLRMQVGDRAAFFNGLGEEAEAEVLRMDRRDLEFRTLSRQKTQSRDFRITLGQAIPKGKNMELIVEKATELGMHAITPLMSERTVMRGTESEHERKQQKWQRVAVEACKQCGQNWLPTVRRPLAPKTFFETAEKFDVMLVASLQSDARPLKSVLAGLKIKRPLSVLMLVGPEGDFTPAEMVLVKNHGCIPVSLGPIILRTETAAIYCLSVLNHELQC